MAEIKPTVTTIARAHDITPMAMGATSWSTASKSLLKRFMIWPRGVTSKNLNFARVTECINR